MSSIQLMRQHRSFYNKQKDFNYDKLLPQHIEFSPPLEYAGGYHKDYANMRENMIYGDSLEVNKLFARIVELNDRFRNIKFPALPEYQIFIVNKKDYFPKFRDHE